MIVIQNNDVSCCKDKVCLHLFYFTAKWCGPCQKIKPMIQKLSDGMDDSKVEVCMVDIDENDELSDELQIESVPTFYLFKQQDLLGQCSGGDILQVHALLKEHLID